MSYNNRVQVNEASSIIITTISTFLFVEFVGEICVCLFSVTSLPSRLSGGGRRVGWGLDQFHLVGHRCPPPPLSRAVSARYAATIKACRQQQPPSFPAFPERSVRTSFPKICAPPYCLKIPNEMLFMAPHSLLLALSSLSPKLKLKRRNIFTKFIQNIFPQVTK